jgi:hypothetical protein
MQTQLSDGRTSSNILTKPAHILSFVQHVLASATSSPSGADHNPKLKQNGGQALRFIPDEVHDLSDGSDSDDDTPDAELVSPDEEMIETAINLLLSILEGAKYFCMVMVVYSIANSQRGPVSANGTDSQRHIFPPSLDSK